jgi:hypothetical protein
MARKTARQRYQNRIGNGLKSSIGDGDWIVTGQGVLATGAPQALSGWAPLGFTLTDLIPQSLLLVALPTAAAATGQPTIGHVEIAAVHGKISFGLQSTVHGKAVAVAMYIAELNSSATAWSVRDPLTPSDANRDDYLYLDTRYMIVPTVATTTAGWMNEFILGLPRPIRIGGGQALCLTVSTESLGGTDTCACVPFVRALVRRAT